MPIRFFHYSCIAEGAKIAEKRAEIILNLLANPHFITEHIYTQSDNLKSKGKRNGKDIRQLEERLCRRVASKPTLSGFRAES
jgi:hypothetical protein